MSVFLMILKWIGIILGGVVGLLLFLVILLLFVPVRYKVELEKQETFQYGFCLSLLLHLLTVKKKKQSKKIKLYLFGIPIRTLADESVEEVTQKETTQEEALEESSTSDETQEENQTEDLGETQEETTSDDKEGKKKRKKEKKKGKKNFSFGKLSSIIGFVKDKTNQSAFGTIKSEVVSLILYVLPKKVKGDVRVGTGDPATTGMLIGGISLFPAAYQKGLRILPDFEEKVFLAQGYVKGRVRTIYLLRLAIRLYRDKEIKRMIKMWKQSNKKEAV